MSRLRCGCERRESATECAQRAHESDGSAEEPSSDWVEGWRVGGGQPLGAPKRARARVRRGFRGNALESRTYNRRTLTETSAPILNSFVRRVPACALANSVPASPTFAHAALPTRTGARCRRTGVVWRTGTGACCGGRAPVRVGLKRSTSHASAPFSDSSRLAFVAGESSKRPMATLSKPFRRRGLALPES